MPLGVENLLAQVALAEHRVTGDQAAFQHQSLQQPEGGLVFIRLVDAAVGDLRLGDRQPRLVGDQRQQMHRLVQAVETAAGRLPVQGASLGWRLVTPGAVGPTRSRPTGSERSRRRSDSMR